MMIRLAGMSLSLMLAGCSLIVPPLDLDGRLCDCVEGWRCDHASGQCVPLPDAGLVARDGGSMDSGFDDLDGGRSSDDGGRDSGPRDAGRDSPVEPVDSGMGEPCFGWAWCDGFEDGLAPWRVVTVDPHLVELTTSTVHSGSNALRVVVGGAFFQAIGAQADAVPQPPPRDLWFRAFYFVPTANPLDFEFHEISGDSENTVVTHLIDGTLSNLHTHGYSDGRSADFERGFARGRWVCVELHVHRDLVSGAYELFWDDELVVSHEGVNTVQPADLTTFHAGMVWRGADDPAELFVDDVAVHTSRIGCDLF